MKAAANMEAAPSRAQKIGAILFFGFSSASIIYFNKIVLYVYGFNYVFCLMAGQMLLSVLLIQLFARLGYIARGTIAVDRAMVLKVFPLTLFFTLDVILGMSALRLVNIPMFTALRRMTIVFVMVLEYLVLNVRATWPTVRAVSFMLVGAGVASAGDLTFDLLGYVFALLNDTTTAMYRITIKKLQLGQVTAFSMMYYNSLLGLPVVLFAAFVTGELERVQQFEYLYDAQFQTFFLISCVMAFMLNFSMFRCTLLNSALTTGVTGQAKNVLVAFVGFFAFGDVKYHPLNVTGHAVCLMGSILYFLATLKKSDPKKSDAATPDSHPQLDSDGPDEGAGCEDDSHIVDLELQRVQQRPAPTESST